MWALGTVSAVGTRVLVLFFSTNGTNIEMGPRPDESASNLFCWAFVMWMREGGSRRLASSCTYVLSSSRVADSSGSAFQAGPRLHTFSPCLLLLYYSLNTTYISAAGSKSLQDRAGCDADGLLPSHPPLKNDPAGCSPATIHMCAPSIYSLARQFQLTPNISSTHSSSYQHSIPLSIYVVVQTRG